MRVRGRGLGTVAGRGDSERRALASGSEHVKMSYLEFTVSESARLGGGPRAGRIAVERKCIELDFCFGPSSVPLKPRINNVTFSNAAHEIKCPDVFPNAAAFMGASIA